ncbi:natterin-4-like [Discoglossus pictus]
MKDLIQSLHTEDKMKPSKKMKTILLCLLVPLSWGFILVNSLALPTSDLKDAPKEAKGLQPEIATDLAPRPNQHNIDLSKIRTSGEAKNETVEKTATFSDSRQLIFNDYVSLKWVEWAGSIPSGAVYIYNQFTNRYDYVCSVQGCATGYYSPSTGPYCFYPNSGSEYKTTSFKILVNEDNFEVIEWQSGSYGSVPTNPIGRCPGTYVGKNQYGLGKVVPTSRFLFLPYSGSEFTYDYYEVLRLYTNYHTQAIRNVVYTTSQVLYNKEPVQVLALSKVVNNVCQRVYRQVTLSKTTINDQSWDIGRPTKSDAISMLTTQILSFSGQTITYLSSQDFEWIEGIPLSISKTHSRSLQVTVEPNYECEVELRGRVIYASMPFRAQLSRTYQNGQLKSTTIQGTFSNVQTDEISIALKQCSRIPNSAPCP